jgi:hypothetical protein
LPLLTILRGLPGPNVSAAMAALLLSKLYPDAVTSPLLTMLSGLPSPRVSPKMPQA